MHRFVGTMMIVGVMALAVYGGAVLLLPSFLPSVVSLGAVSNVPSAINHQGVVMVSGTRFTGTGSFKFAIVSTDGNNVWTNDGTQVGTSNEPTAGVSLSVADGVYSVALGASPMTAISPGLFADGNLVLRIWFSHTSSNFVQLSPDHQLASVPYAMTVADGAVTNNKLADNVVTSTKLASNVGVWTKSGTQISYSGGNVGIGTASPSAALQVAGALKASTVNGNNVARSTEFQVFGACDSPFSTSDTNNWINVGRMIVAGTASVQPDTLPGTTRYYRIKVSYSNNLGSSGFSEIRYLCPETPGTEVVRYTLGNSWCDETCTRSFISNRFQVNEVGANGRIQAHVTQNTLWIFGVWLIAEDVIQ